MKKTLLFLGTGGSVGVPMIGCPCEVCRSNDPKNKRLRPSVLLKIGERRYLIDAGPDFRTQALKFGIINLDGVLLTHAHHDHTAGLDDLRPLYYRRHGPIPVLLSTETAQEVQIRFSYLMKTEEEKPKSRFTFQILSDREGEVEFEDLSIQYVSYVQGGMWVNGFRFGDLAYLSDIKHFSNSIYDKLKGVRFLIVSALRYTSSPLHFSVDDAIAFTNELKVEKAWLTHVSHELEQHKTNSYLPEHIRLAYDGLEIEFN